MNEDATQVVEVREIITLKDSIFDAFIAACDKAKVLNQALLDAAKLADESGVQRADF